MDAGTLLVLGIIALVWLSGQLAGGPLTFIPTGKPEGPSVLDTILGTTAKLAGTAGAAVEAVATTTAAVKGTEAEAEAATIESGVPLTAVGIAAGAGAAAVGLGAAAAGPAAVAAAEAAALTSSVLFPVAAGAVAPVIAVPTVFVPTSGVLVAPGAVAAAADPAAATAAVGSTISGILGAVSIAAAAFVAFNVIAYALQGPWDQVEANWKRMARDYGIYLDKLRAIDPDLSLIAQLPQNIRDFSHAVQGMMQPYQAAERARMEAQIQAWKAQLAAAQARVLLKWGQ